MARRLVHQWPGPASCSSSADQQQTMYTLFYNKLLNSPVLFSIISIRTRRFGTETPSSSTLHWRAINQRAMRCVSAVHAGRVGLYNPSPHRHTHIRSVSRRDEFQARGVQRRMLTIYIPPTVDKTNQSTLFNNFVQFQLAGNMPIINTGAFQLGYCRDLQRIVNDLD